MNAFINTNGNVVFYDCYQGESGNFHEDIAQINIGDGLETEIGFIDKSGKIIIPCLYHDVGEFSEGLSSVGYSLNYGRWNYKYGYIDKYGDLAIEQTFIKAKQFHDGLAAVINEKYYGYYYGFINSKGKMVIQPLFEDAGDFSNGFAPVKIDGKWGYIRKPYKNNYEPLNTDSFTNNNYQTNITQEIDSFDFAIKPSFDDAWPFSDGLARVYLAGRYGFIDAKGNLKIDTAYIQASDFINGAAKVCAKYSGLTDTTYIRWFYINKNGEKISKEAPLYDFSEGIGIVGNHFIGYIYIDLNGNCIINKKFGSAGCFSDGAAITRSCGNNLGNRLGDWSYIDKKGERICWHKHGIPLPYSEGLRPSQENGNIWGYRDKTGKVIIKPRFTIALGFSEGYAAVKIDSMWGYIDKSGKIVIIPKFDRAYSFTEGLARICINDKFGFINTAGEFAIEPLYKEAEDFSEGFSVIKIGEAFGFINKSGKIVIATKFKKVRNVSQGYAPVLLGCKWGYLKVNNN